MKRPDLVIHGHTYDPSVFRIALGMVRTLAGARDPWTACAEEHRSGTMSIRLSTSVSRQLTLSVLEDHSTVTSIDIPWNIDGGRDVVDAAAAVRAVADHMDLLIGAPDDMAIADAWIIGTAGIMRSEGHDPILVTLKGPSTPLAVLGTGAREISSPLIERLDRACPITLQAECDTSGDMLWIQASGGLTGEGESHCLVADPIATLRAIAFVRARLDATG